MRIAKIDCNCSVFIYIIYAKTHTQPLSHSLGVNVLRNGVAYAALSEKFNTRRVLLKRSLSTLHKSSGTLTCKAGFFGDIIDKVMHMKDVSTGKNSGYGCLKMLRDYGSASYARKFYTGLTREIVFGKQAHRKQQGIARIEFLRTGDGSTVSINLGDLHCLHALLAINPGDGM